MTDRHANDRQRRHRRKLEIAREVGAVRWAAVPLNGEQIARLVFVSGFSLEDILRMDDVELGRVISDELVKENLGDMSLGADEPVLSSEGGIPGCSSSVGGAGADRMLAPPAIFRKRG